MNPEIKSIYANFFDINENKYYKIVMGMDYTKIWKIWKSIVEKHWIGDHSGKITRI